MTYLNHTWQIQYRTRRGQRWRPLLAESFLCSSEAHRVLATLDSSDPTFGDLRVSRVISRN